MGAFTMGWRKLLMLVMILGLSQISKAQSPTYGVGRTPTAEEIRAWDISIGTAGKELPPGHGTANPEAYSAYLLGRQLHTQNTVPTWRQAIEAYQTAIELDPNGPYGAEAKKGLEQLQLMAPGIDTKVNTKKKKS